jgi:uncharacterized protein YbjT (DUF2867 family)
MNVLVTGVSGYVGSRLVPRLLADGHTVRGLSRHPARARAELADVGRGRVEIVGGDAVTGAGLAQALDGVDVAYFLIHSMEPSVDRSFAARERAAATNFAAAARSAETARIIYLGGLIPPEGPTSPHLASRLAVERILLDAAPCSVSFRASIVIGARSRSFRLLVRLVERMPVLALPAWQTHRTNPLDERDMVEFLARAATSERVCGRTLEIGGPEVVSYGELIDRIRDHLLLARPTFALRRITATPIASRLAALIAGEEHELVGPLMESLGRDLLVRDRRAAELLEVRLHSLDAAIERALREWEAVEPLAAR